MIIELIDWNGGEMPVESLTVVLVVHRDRSMATCFAGHGMAETWNHNGGPDDIIAYKVLE